MTSTKQGWAVVTGASEGLGRHIATGLAAGGRPVVVVARRAAELEALAAQLRADHGVDVRVAPIDLGASDGAERLDEATADLDVEVVVLNAGFGVSGPLLDADLGRLSAMIDVNCRAVLGSSQRFGRRLVARGGGSLVLVSSVLAFQGAPFAAAYAATKAFVQSLGEALDVELGPQGVAVAVAAVGPTHTGFAREAGMRFNLAMTAESVAAGIVRGVGTRGTLRPGWMSWWLPLSMFGLPRWVRARIYGVVMRSSAA